jgi:hypothetical protein
MTPHRALLSTPRTQHDWREMGRAYGICAVATAINSNGARTERRSPTRFMTGGNGINPLRVSLSIRLRTDRLIWRNSHFNLARFCHD